MRDCECRFLTTAFYGYTPKQGGEVAVLFAQQRPGALRQNSSQIPVPFACGTGVPFAPTFVVAGRQPSPTCQVSGVRKPAHVKSDLGNNHGGGCEVHARNGAETQNQVRMRLELLGQTLIDLLQL